MLILPSRLRQLHRRWRFQTFTRQILAKSGLEIHQDIFRAIRFVMFDTGFESWRYATDGGNAFLINFNNAVYLITAGHVKGTFQWPQMVLTGRQLCRHGDSPARFDGPWSPTVPIDGAVGSDIMDLSIFKVNETLSFFHDPLYIIDKNTVGMSNEGDKLLACGLTCSQ